MCDGDFRKKGGEGGVLCTTFLFMGAGGEGGYLLKGVFCICFSAFGVFFSQHVSSPFDIPKVLFLPNPPFLSWPSPPLIERNRRATLDFAKRKNKRKKKEHYGKRACFRLSRRLFTYFFLSRLLAGEEKGNRWLWYRQLTIRKCDR